MKNDLFPKISDKPILFQTEMVRAILEDRKSQTRRVIKPQPAHSCYYTMNGDSDKALHLITNGTPDKFCAPVTSKTYDHRLPCPYGTIGDLLWVRETFSYKIQNLGGTPDEKLIYKADGEVIAYYDHNNQPYKVKWKPSIFMPRRHSRITLEITDIRVERLHCISEDDAEAEGIEFANIKLEEYEAGASNQYIFLKLWDLINGKASTDSNPWVWVLEFITHKINIDELIKKKL